MGYEGEVEAFGITVKASVTINTATTATVHVDITGLETETVQCETNYTLQGTGVILPADSECIKAATRLDGAKIKQIDYFAQVDVLRVTVTPASFPDVSMLLKKKKPRLTVASNLGNCSSPSGTYKGSVTAFGLTASAQIDITDATDAHVTVDFTGIETKHIDCPTSFSCSWLDSSKCNVMIPADSDCETAAHKTDGATIQGIDYYPTHNPS